MNNDISNMIDNCHICNKYKKLRGKDPLLLREVPDGPWQTLGIDLFHLKGEDFLLVIDYYSKFPEVAKLQNLSSAATITILKSLFSRFGIPKRIYSDNGPQFNSLEMRVFAKQWGFEHITSSPHYPQSNGMVERHIQTIKNMFTKVQADGKDIYLALLEYRNTPLDHNIQSPSEILLRQKTNGLLPLKSKNNVDHRPKTRELLEQRQLIQKRYYDRNTYAKTPAQIEDQVYVRIRPNSPLKRGRIIKECDRPRSFAIKLDDGRVFERNRSHIHVTKQPSSDRTNNSQIAKSQLENDTDLNHSTRNDSNSCTNSNDTCETPKQGLYTRSGRLSKPPNRLSDYIVHRVKSNSKSHEILCKKGGCHG